MLLGDGNNMITCIVTESLVIKQLGVWNLNKHEKRITVIKFKKMNGMVQCTDSCSVEFEDDVSLICQM